MKLVKRIEGSSVNVKDAKGQMNLGANFIDSSKAERIELITQLECRQ